jgi:hypothetical protein
MGGSWRRRRLSTGWRGCSLGEGREDTEGWCSTFPWGHLPTPAAALPFQGEETALGSGNCSCCPSCCCRRCGAPQGVLHSHIAEIKLVCVCSCCWQHFRGYFDLCTGGYIDPFHPSTRLAGSLGYWVCGAAHLLLGLRVSLGQRSQSWCSHWRFHLLRSHLDAAACPSLLAQNGAVRTLMDAAGAPNTVTCWVNAGAPHPIPLPLCVLTHPELHGFRSWRAPGMHPSGDSLLLS